jgi:hypothetical protein
LLSATLRTDQVSGVAVTRRNPIAILNVHK